MRTFATGVPDGRYRTVGLAPKYPASSIRFFCMKILPFWNHPLAAWAKICFLCSRLRMAPAATNFSVLLAYACRDFTLVEVEVQLLSEPCGPRAPLLRARCAQLSPEG